MAQGTLQHFLVLMAPPGGSKCVEWDEGAVGVIVLWDFSSRSCHALGQHGRFGQPKRQVSSLLDKIFILTFFVLCVLLENILSPRVST